MPPASAVGSDSRAQAPRAGGLGAAFRFCSGGRAHTRRTAHEQGGGSVAGQCLRLGFTHPSPMSRGLGCFVSFLFRRQSAYTADGPRAGGRQCRRTVPSARIHAPKPHEQGAWALRFVSVPATERTHGGRPTSRGRPPAAVGGRETGENGRWFPKTAAGGTSLLVGLPPSTPTPPQPTRTAATPPPASGAGVRLHGAEGYWLSALPTGPPPRQIWPW